MRVWVPHSIYFILQDAPVECARLFHERMEHVMEQWLFLKGGKVKGVLGRIKDYLIRYEVQDRG